MSDQDPMPAEILQPGDCVSYRLRRAARTAARFYDMALKPCGLRNTQFTLLASLRRFKEANIGDLSEALAIDGTTLTRNLNLLVKKGLVENFGMDDGRVRNLRLSELGNAMFEEALPLWQEAQHQVLVALEPEPWYVLRAQLGKIEVACTPER